jgi:hypothetical protein
MPQACCGVAPRSEEQDLLRGCDAGGGRAGPRRFAWPSSSLSSSCVVMDDGGSPASVGDHLQAARARPLPSRIEGRAVAGRVSREGGGRRV